MTITAPPSLSLPRTPASSLRRNPASPWRHVDVVLVACVLAVACIGVLMVFSATRGAEPPFDTTYLKKQAMFVLLGLGVMGLTCIVDYRVFRDWAFVFYGGAVLLLLAVVSPLGSTSKGTQAWFQLGPFQLQPSEMAKLGLIVGLAALAAQFRNDVDLRRLLALLVVAGVPFGLIMLQPDLGTGLVILSITVVVLLVAGARSKHLAALVLLAAVLAGLVLQSGLLEEYQRCRLTSFLDREDSACAQRGAAYNLDQSMIAIGAGGLLGRGLFNGSQTRLDNVPEQHTDFIFTAVGEELGLVGAGTLLVLLCVIVWRIWRIAQLARDQFGTFVCAGVLAMLVFQIFENVGMTMGIMPITGIPLPFLSYGGSSTLAAFAAIGLALNVHMRRFA